MGRKPKPEDEKNNAILPHIRCRQEQLERYDAAAKRNKKTRSKWVLETLDQQIEKDSKKTDKTRSLK